MAVSALANTPADAWIDESWKTFPHPRRPAFVGHFLRSLRRRSDWTRDGKRWRGLKYVVCALSMPRRHLRFLALVFGHPTLSGFAARDPRMLERHFHPFLNRNWHRLERLRALTQHYQCVLSRMKPTATRQIYARGGLALGALELKNGDAIRVCLRPPHFLGCEGELYIELEDADGRMLYRVALTMIEDGTALAIGCIQGPKGEDKRETVRALTRNLHGLRPKDLMLALARRCAACLGARRILAIANAAHPLRKGGGIAADYDAFWIEQHGLARANGWYELPGRVPRKSEAEIDSRHRAAYRRREALRARAEILLTEALGAPFRRSAGHGMAECAETGAPTILRAENA